MHVVVGLGNPDDEYTGTRHNTGRTFVEHLHERYAFSEWKIEKKPPLRWANGSIEGKKSLLVLPDTFMNHSGRAVAHFVKSKKEAGNTVVVYDDLDLPLGTIKISHGRSSGGHNGVESVIKALKTRDFVRVRVGVARPGAKGRAVKPKGDDRVIKYLLGKFTPSEKTALKKIATRVGDAVAAIITEGYQKAMTDFNR